MYIFDNTASVRKFAQTEEAKKILDDIPNGRESQLYKVGDIVDGDGLGFYNGKIVDVYSQYGYYYYVVEYKLKSKARKKYHTTIRQRDVVLVN